MPSASANMSAKFIAQIDTSKACAARNSEPADAISPRIVSMSGRPAATSDPNASTRIASVTGQRDELGLQHRGLVRVVEVRPHARRAGEADGDFVRAERRELALQLVGGLHHLGWARGRPGLQDDSPAVAGALRRRDGRDAVVALEDRRDACHDRSELAVARYDGHERVRALPAE